MFEDGAGGNAGYWPPAQIAIFVDIFGRYVQAKLIKMDSEKLYQSPYFNSHTLVTELRF